MESQIRDLNRNVETLQNELRAAQKQADKLTQQRDELDVLNAAQKREIRDGEDRIRRLIEEQAALKGELQSVKDGLSRAQGKAESLATERGELQEKVREFTVQLAVAELKTDKFKNDVSVFEEKSKAQAKELSEKEQLLKTATADMLEMQKKLTVVECDARDFERQLARSKVSTEEQDRNMQRLMTERMELTLQLGLKDQTHQKQLDALTEELRAAQAEKAEMLQRVTSSEGQAGVVSELKAELSSLTMRFRDEVDARKQDARALAELQEELRVCKQAEAAAAKALKERQGDVARLEDALKAAKVAGETSSETKALIEGMTAELRDVKQRLEASEAEATRLATALAEAEVERQAAGATALREAQVAAEAARDHLEAELKVVRDELQEAKAAKEAALAQAAEKIAEADGKAAKADAQSAEYEALKQTHSTLDNKYQQLKGHFQKAIEKIEDLRAQRDQKQDQLESLEQSTTRLSAEFNSRTTKQLFESEQWRALLQEIHERVVAHTIIPEPSSDSSNSLMNIFSRKSATRTRVTTAPAAEGAATGRSSNRISPFSTDQVPSESLSSIAGAGNFPLLLEELAALKVRNKVLEDTLTKMQSVITSTSGH